jgi:hypothetical protein
MGYNPNEWEIIFMTFSNWQQHTKEQTTKELYAVKFKMKPATKELVLEDYVNVAKEVFSKEIKPLKLPKKEQQKGLNDELLIECPGIELHLGKLGWYGETGENYDFELPPLNTLTGCLKWGIPTNSVLSNRYLVG